MVTRYIGSEVTGSTLITSYTLNAVLTGGLDPRHNITSEISKTLNDGNSCS